MAKGKKKGGKKKKKAQIDPNALTEVDKTFYELTITDLNRKLARLRSLTAELHEKNEQLETELSTLDEDRNDVIIYLKRMLQEKTDEINELQERLKALEETRHEETEQFEAKIADLENEYKQMHEQLTSEIKLLEGKLNSLEEFRLQRDELMKKFEVQEDMIEEQEIRHKNELYEMERKNIIEKDKLKKDMEARLIQLSSEFQDVTELRIAATTHRVIRENIAINTELDAMLNTHAKLHEQNATMKQRDRIARQERELHEAEKKQALSKVNVQLKIVEQLTREHADMSQKLQHFQHIENEMIETNREMSSCKQTVDNLNYRIRVLEQNLHSSKCNEQSTRMDYILLEETRDQLVVILDEAVCAIKEVLELNTATSTVSDVSLKVSKRESLLPHLLQLLSQAETIKPRKPSLETVSSASAAYARGDLGFVPKPVPTKRRALATVRNIEAQVGASFEEFVTVPVTLSENEGEEVVGGGDAKSEKSGGGSGGGEEGVEGEEVVQVESDVFYGEDVMDEEAEEREEAGEETEGETEAGETTVEESLAVDKEEEQEGGEGGEEVVDAVEEIPEDDGGQN